jgi:hypothetical protein
MIDWSSYLVSNIMVVNVVNVHYYERYVNSPIPLDGTLERIA